MKSLLPFFLLLPFSVYAHSSSQCGYLENKGQFHTNVMFKGDFMGYTAYLERDGWSFSMLDNNALTHTHECHSPSDHSHDLKSINGHAYRIRLAEASEAIIRRINPMAHSTNFFIGRGKSRRISDVKSYRAVEYIGIYPGVDARALSQNGNFKYEFIIAPGANPEEIKMEYEGVENISVRDGQLVLETSVGVFKELQPYAYQMQGLVKKEVDCGFQLDGNRVSFNVTGEFDSSLELVIDPVLVAATLSGTPGFGSNYGHGSAVDNEGNIYTFAKAFGPAYPVTVGAFQVDLAGGLNDIAISKYNPTGTELLYATYLGGSQDETPMASVVDNNNDLYVLGFTNSNDFPVMESGYDTVLNVIGSIDFEDRDLFVVKLSSAGNELLAGTYIGGSAGDGLSDLNMGYGTQARSDIVLKPDGSVLVLSNVESDNFPTTENAFMPTNQGGQDAVLFQMNSELTSLNWSTYIGSSQSDFLTDLAISSNGDLVVSGFSKGTDFPVSSNAYQTELADNSGLGDGVVARLSSDGTELLQGTYLGTDGADQIYFFDFDYDENIWVCGYTSSDEWEVIGDGYNVENGNLFLTKFDGNLESVLVSSRIGSGTLFAGRDCTPAAFDVDDCNRVKLSSYGAESGFELTEDAIDTAGQFIVQAWSAELGELLFTTYMAGYPAHIDGGVGVFDETGNLIQGVCSSGQFTPNPGAWATEQFVGWDVGVFKIDFEFPGRLSPSIIGLDSLAGCAPFEIALESGVPGDSYFWQWGDGSQDDTGQSAVHTYTEVGEYEVELTVYDSLSCNGSVSSQFLVSVGDIPEAGFGISLEGATNEFTFVNQSLNADSITWIINGDTLGVSTETVVVFLEEGSNEICIIAENNCGTDVYCHTIVTTSAGDNAEPQGAVIFPNPVKDQLTVTNLQPNTAIRLFDTTGKALGNSVYNQFDRVIIDTSHLSRGVYMLTIENGIERKVLKFSKL